MKPEQIENIRSWLPSMWDSTARKNFAQLICEYNELKDCNEKLEAVAKAVADFLAPMPLLDTLRVARERQSALAEAYAALDRKET